MRTGISMLFVCCLTACDDGKPAGGNTTPADKPEATATDAKPYKRDPATQGTVTGRVLFSGQAPAVRTLAVNCEGSHQREARDESVLVNGNGTLRNVFVYVSKGTRGWKFEPPADAVVLDQKDCAYVPHVFGIQAGQPLLIKNSDPTMHNVHGLPTESDPFNKMQQAGGSDTVILARSEVMVQIKCDVHGWMGAWAGVVNHPFHDVTGDDGAFELAGLPAGDYTIAAYHEKFGPRKLEVKVEAGAPAAIEFTFEGK
ncbi:MAG: hypothetical protein A3F84_15920 [Candidatus Handelsmanbacteria bacterium RIFCSPLOWO2_12_FULL_64_10]|uniref:Rhamnogalacturonan lyase domain-containing protein n=1 Tax=Handelsmanbacteria sp. (strain RIFCSPLOWO2_12_FULL_64_10) TaxID=1817868 RepID=A0A1F6CBJ2_HANXR|nr:MAG: hypothetical protein A3F84_15920 [Candidatus Handelsmanbacteria bacterium RIFCSPLOWO2_12_FULL_64_10]